MRFNRDVRNQLLISHTDYTIVDEEFIVLCDLWDLDFPCDCYTDFDTAFDLDELDESQSVAEFGFRKRNLRTLSNVLQIPDTTICDQRSILRALKSHANYWSERFLGFLLRKSGGHICNVNTRIVILQKEQKHNSLWSCSRILSLIRVQSFANMNKKNLRKELQEHFFTCVFGWTKFPPKYCPRRTVDDLFTNTDIRRLT